MKYFNAVFSQGSSIDSRIYTITFQRKVYESFKGKQIEGLKLACQTENVKHWAAMQR